MQKNWGPVDCAQSDGLEPIMQHLELTPSTSALLLGTRQWGEVQESGQEMSVGEQSQTGNIQGEEAVVARFCTHCLHLSAHGPKEDIANPLTLTYRYDFANFQDLGLGPCPRQLMSKNTHSLRLRSLPTQVLPHSAQHTASLESTAALFYALCFGTVIILAHGPNEHVLTEQIG